MTVVAPKSVEAVIVDDAGTIVAQRTLTDRSAKVCLPLARAVGAWASLVLDAELVRAKDDDGSEPTPPPQPLAPSSATATSSGLPVNLASRSLRDVAPGAEGEGSASPRRSIELGSMMYLRNGMTSTGGFGGISPFVTVEVAPSWVLRPALAFGRSTSAIPISTAETAMMSHVGGRADFCRRVPGNYIERRGIEADLCFGVEGGVVTSDRGASGRGGDAARFGLGPSANLRGELALGIALEVRGLLGANLLNQPVLDEPPVPLVFAAAELGVSVRLP